MFKRLVFVSMVGLASVSQASHQYEFVVTSSPSVHNLTDRIPATLIKEAKYDLTQFTLKGTLDPKTFAWDGTKGKESEVVKKILEEQFQIYGTLKTLSEKGCDLQTPAFNRCLLDLVKLYQEIEAEGVFYRDLKRQLDLLHHGLMGNAEYEATRTNNLRIVEGFFDIVEELVRNSKMQLELWCGNSSRCKSVRSKGPEVLIQAFLKHIYGSPEDKGVLAKTKEKVDALRQRCKLPGAKPITADANNNNN